MDVTASGPHDKPGASIPELALDYSIGESTLYRMAQEGKLPGARRIGKRVIVHRETFEAWLKEGKGND